MCACNHLYSILLGIAIGLPGVAATNRVPGAGSGEESEFAAAPYPQSPVIAGVEWAPADEIIRLAPGGDTWPLTWGDDGHLYTAYGDGWGFEPRIEKFFVKRDEQDRPVWTWRIGERGAVFEHAGRCYRSGISYSDPFSTGGIPRPIRVQSPLGLSSARPPVHLPWSCFDGLRRSLTRLLELRNSL
jgi:hypothetical protein